MSHPNTNTNDLHTTMRLLLQNQSQLLKMINEQLPKIDQNYSDFEENLMTKLKACKTCGEIGHTSKECPDEWPHCDANYLVEEYPIPETTCFLCEGTSHVPAQCQLYPLVQ